MNDIGRNRAHGPDAMKKILVIDDNPAIGTMVARMLEGGAFDCTVLTSGENLIERLATEHEAGGIDLLITDILMPRVEGIEIIMKVRQSLPDLPIIAMSGGGHSIGKDVLKSAQQLGANAVLTKPFTRQDLLAAIDEVLLE